MDRLVDRFGRRITYLRISVTDRCNMRCIYCMPPQGITHKHHSDILSFEEIYKIVKAASSLGVDKVRITGGEPLVRKDLVSLIESLKTIDGLKDIALTTNGTYLKSSAPRLKKAGLDRVNVSLDSLIPERFEEITRGGNLRASLDGIEASLSAGLEPVKINTVLIKGFNTDEIPAFADLARTRPLHVRFIEYMRTNLNDLQQRPDLFFSCPEAKDICAKLGRLKSLYSGQGSTAKVYAIEGFRGTIGFVSPISRSFCASCDKLRLTSDGRLRSCLHSSYTINLKEALSRTPSEEELADLFKKAVSYKPMSHDLAPWQARRPREDFALLRSRNSPSETRESFSMCQIGG